MHKCSALAAALALFLSVVDLAAQTPMKKYDIKSGIVTFETIMTMGKMKIDPEGDCLF